MSTPYGDNDPQQWGGGSTGGYGPQGQPQPGQWGQQGPPQSPPQPQQGWGPPSGGYPAQGPPPQQPGQPQQGWGPPSGGFPAQGPPPQQPGQPPPGYGPYPGQPPERKKSKAPLWIGLAVVVVLLGAVAVLGWVAPGFFTGKVFDAGSVEQGVEEVLGQQGHNVESVSCPGDQEVSEGHTFSCDVTIGGQEQAVEIEVVDADADPPEYEVKPPQGG